MGIAALAGVAGIYFAAVSNIAFWREASRAGAFAGPNGFAVAGALFILLASLHVVLVCAILPGRFAKSGLTVLVLFAAVVNEFLSRSAMPVDPAMEHGLLLADSVGALDAMTADVVLSLATQSALPGLLLWRVRVQPMSWAMSIATRALTSFVALSLASMAVALPFHEVKALFRDSPSLPYLMTPGNGVVDAIGRLLGPIHQLMAQRS